MTHSRTLKSIIVIGTALSITALTACSPREIDRTKRRPHTAQRGVAFKKLVLTFNEANALARRADEYAALMNASPDVDDQTKSDAIKLVEETRAFADDIEWSLANNQRMTWHRTEMNRLWDRYLDLYPQDEDYAENYTTWTIRKPTTKFRLKQNYKENYGIERSEPRWEDLKPVIREFYETE